MPDIDTDFPDNERGKVLEYMGRRYGKMRVAHICTFGTYGPKLAVRDVSRVIELSNIYLDEILKLLGDSNSILDVLNSNETYKRMYEEDDVVRFVTDTVARMENLPRNSSVHAAGIIMADCDLIEYTPLANSIDGLYESQYEASDLEKLGLVKIDFLGLKNLSIISNVLKLISGHNDAINGFNIYNLPLDDKKTYKTIASGNTNGIFQLESSGMRNTLMKLETSEFNDIVSANALYRPGPMDMISSYINRKLGNEKIVYMHPDLEGILKSTYGIIVYQEQILLIASKFAGYSLGEADVLRRAVSKKRLDVLESERSKFVSGAKRKGYSDSVCQEVFDYILKFASYGFNKSHSVSYSMVSYQMAYLKTHYFKEFMAVLMTDKVGSVSSIKSYILECANHRISVLPPSINKSGLDFVIENDNIYYSLLGINGLGDVIVRNIINERNKEKFKNYDEFICRTKDFLNKKHIEGLIYSGALDDFKITRKAMIEEYEQSLQLSTFGEVFREELSTHVFSDDEYSFDVIASYESFALGFNLKFDVFKRYSEYKKKYKTIDLKDVKNKSVALVLFQIQKVRVITTKNNEEMAFVSAYDDSAEMDMVLFPKTYLLYRQIIKNGRVYIAEIKVDTRNNTLQGNVNKLRLLD